MGTQQSYLGYAVAVPRSSHIQRVGRSSDSQAQANGPSRPLWQISRSGQWLNTEKGSLDSAQLQRRGRPGFAPVFPVSSAEADSSLADHQRTINSWGSLAARKGVVKGGRFLAFPDTNDNQGIRDIITNRRSPHLSIPLLGCAADKCRWSPFI